MNKSPLNRLPKHWQNILKKKSLTADDFDANNVVVMFEDGSTCVFQWSFVVEGKDKILVCTEHCGYYEWPKRQVKVIGVKRND